LESKLITAGEVTLALLFSHQFRIAIDLST